MRCARALFEQLEMEQYLAEALGRVDVSVDSIVAKTQPPPSAGPHPVLLLLGIVVCLGVVGFISTVIFLSVHGSPDRNVANRADPGNVDPRDIVSPDNGGRGTHDGYAAGEDPRLATPKPPQPDVDDIADAGEETSQPPDKGEADPPPPEPSGPWVAGLKVPPQAFDAAWFVDFDTQLRIPSQEELKEWFEAVPGQRQRVYEDKLNNVGYGAIDGVMKLKAPWPADAALRFSTAKQDDFRIHAFSGQHGVSIFAYNNPGPTLTPWATYANTRAGDKPLPDSYVLIGTDDSRDFASEVRYGPTLMLRWQEGQLVLTRGDVELARAPLAQPPEEVVFDGKLVFRGIEMLRLTDAPVPAADWPVAVDIEKPAELEWTTRLPDEAKFEKLADGGVQLTSDRAKTVSFAATELPAGTLQMIEVQVGDILPGSGVYLGGPAEFDAEGKEVNPAGRPRGVVLHFLESEDDKRLSARWNHFVSNWRSAKFGKIDEQVTSPVGEDVWVRFLVGSGIVSCWISPDGQTWTHLFHPGGPYTGPISHLGILTSTDIPPSKLTVRRIRTRKLTSLAKLADDAVWRSAAAIPEAANFGAWLTEVTARQPADVDTGAWRRACALKTVGAGCPAPLGQALLDAVLKDPQVQSLPADDRLAVLDEIALLVHPKESLPDGQAFNLPQRYVDIGRDAGIDGQPRPYSLVRRPLSTAPAALRGKYSMLDEDLVRRELLSLIYAGQWREVERFCGQLSFFAGSETNLKKIAPLQPLGRRPPPAAACRRARAKGWRDWKANGSIRLSSSTARRPTT